MSALDDQYEKLEEIADDLLNEGEQTPNEAQTSYISTLTLEELLSVDLIDSVLVAGATERELLLGRLRVRARELRSLTAFNRAVEARQREIAEVRRGNSQNLSKFPEGVQQLNVGEWTADQGGVRRYRAAVRNELVEEYASPVAICPTELMTNVDTGTKKIQLSYYKDGWHNVVCDRSVSASCTKIIELADHGVEVNSENAKLLVRYIADCVALNLDKIPETNSVSHLGWHEGRFVPYSSDTKFDGEGEFKQLHDALTSVGDFEEWRTYMRELRKNIYFRLVMGVSFASVLLRRINALPFVLHLWGGTSAGKAQPLDTKIITPDGYKLMGDIRVGDTVIGGDGKPHKVSGVFPQGVKDVYELTFADGRKTRCCKEHLWNLTTRTRRNHKRGYVTMELQEMLSRKPIKTNKGYEYNVPLCKPVEYNTGAKLPIDPYLLGALIGDGCLKMTINKANGSRYLYFNNSEDDVISRVRVLLEQNGSRLVRNYSTTNQFAMQRCNWLKKAIRSLGVDKGSLEKFIPEVYLTATPHDRKRLLYGLMDTDGHVGLGGECSYSTNSKRLARDVQRLARSLGYKASVHSCVRLDKANVEYEVYISTDENIFLSDKHIRRKKHSLSTRNRAQDKHAMAIVEVKPCGQAECQCIMVDSEEHTYLCDDFIVTHNTVSLMAAMSVWGDPSMGKLVRTMNMTVNAMMTTASFLRDLPFAGDELQTIKSRYENYDKLIMSVCEGVERGRMTFSTVNETKSWNCAFVFSGEEPLTQSSSGGGAKNRVIEIECKHKVIENGPEVVEFVKHNYGHAGRHYIEWLSQRDDREIKQLYSILSKTLLELDTTDKQALSMAAIMLGDACGSAALFPGEPALTLDDVKGFLKSGSEVDTAERAYDLICDEIAIHDARFSVDANGDTHGETWGKMDEDICYIVKTQLERILRTNGFEFDAVKAKWASSGKLIKNSQGRYYTNTKCNNSRGNYVLLRLPNYTPRTEVQSARC